jgi:hypothetical protein
MCAIQPQVKLEKFQRARGRFLDKFAEIEQSVIVLLKLSGAKCGNDSLGQKVESLRNFIAQLKCLKPQFSVALEALDDLEQILPLRNDIVHSRLALAIVDGASHALFRNTRFIQDRAPPVRLLSLKDFKHLEETLTGITTRLSVPTEINPASSPPQPSPGAATAP